MPDYIIHRHVSYLADRINHEPTPEPQDRSTGPRNDLTGQRFGSVTVLRLYDQKPGKHYRWLCKCDCGRVSAMYQTNLFRRKHPKCNDCANKIRTERRRKLPIAEVTALLKEGLTQPQIAKRFGCTQAAISYIACKHGLGGKAIDRKAKYRSIQNGT